VAHVDIAHEAWGDLLSRGDDLAAWFERSMAALFHPIIERDAGLFDVQLWGALDLFFKVTKTYKKWSPENEAEFAGRLRNGDFPIFGFAIQILDEGPHGTPYHVAEGLVHMNAAHEETDVSYGPNNIKVWFQLEHIPFDVGLSRVVECGQATAALAGSGSGDISVHPQPRDRYYDHKFEWFARPMRVPRNELKQPDEWISGVYWGNMLGPHHIEKLGGLDRVLSTDACPIRTTFGHDQVYLQASERLEDCRLEDLARLHEFLEPVLPEAFRDEAIATEAMTYSADAL
jgi:hypothetical protein